MRRGASPRAAAITSSSCLDVLNVVSCHASPLLLSDDDSLEAGEANEMLSFAMGPSLLVDDDGTELKSPTQLCAQVEMELRALQGQGHSLVLEQLYDCVDDLCWLVEKISMDCSLAELASSSARDVGVELIHRALESADCSNVLDSARQWSTRKSTSMDAVLAAYIRDIGRASEIASEAEAERHPNAADQGAPNGACHEPVAGGNRGKGHAPMRSNADHPGWRMLFMACGTTLERQAFVRGLFENLSVEVASKVAA